MTRSTCTTAMVLLVVSGCASTSHRAPDAANSAGASSSPTAAGRATGGTARAMILSAGVGGPVGGVIGRQMDQQAKEISQNIPGATVERVGDGLVITFFTGTLFEFDSDRVLGESAKILRTLARSLDKYQGTDVFIVGHTDALGTAEYNLALSLRRARATAAYLTSQGVLLERLKTQGRGETEPVSDNNTEAGQARNRRLEVAIYPNEAYKAKLAKDMKKQ